MQPSPRRVEKQCAQCGQTFSIKLSHQAQKFCNNACKRTYEIANGRPAAQIPKLEFTCKECGKAFFYKPSIVKAYRAKHGKDPLYCSMPCSDIGRRKDTMERQRFSCLQCGKEQSRRRKPGGRVYMQQKFCDRKCKADYQRAHALERFQTEPLKRYTRTRGGYAYISLPSLVTGRKSSILEHRYVMSKFLSRDLRPEETVHHKNGNRQDNRLENLELFSSNHGTGQRVIDKVAFAIEILRLYPEFAKAAGVALVDLDQVSAEPIVRETLPTHP